VPASREFAGIMTQEAILIHYRFVHIALKRNPTNVVPLEGADLDVALEAQPAEKIEPTATA